MRARLILVRFLAVDWFSGETNVFLLGAGDADADCECQYTAKTGEMYRRSKLKTRNGMWLTLRISSLKSSPQKVGFRSRE